MAGSISMVDGVVVADSTGTTSAQSEDAIKQARS